MSKITEQLRSLGDQYVKVVEVGPRDGLQNEKKQVETNTKLEYIKKLIQAGLDSVEITSFVSPRAIAQMSDAKDLYQRFSKLSYINSIEAPCLVPNLKGYETAKSLGVNEIALFTATSSSFTQKNINATVEESFTRMGQIITLAKKDSIKVRGYISTAFGCPYEGAMSLTSLMKVVEKFLDYGVYELSIGDTIGVATPLQVSEYVEELVKVVGTDKLAMHFHDTRSMAITNILKSLEHGVRIFDASSGGLGGCPYANGATGNVATEELVYLFDSLGLRHGIDLDKLTAASKYILDHIGKETPSKFLKAYWSTKK